jgi:NAD-dependent deacetylase
LKKIVVFTGAGMSQESGINTFRDADGLWEGHDVMQVASIEGWHKNKEIVLDFYNTRRTQLKSVHPNHGHLALKKLEEKYKVTIVTQNVDDLHERAGSKDIIHLHGSLIKAKGETNKSQEIHWTDDIKIGDRDDHGAQMRPAIVWFGEAVPMMQEAAYTAEEADIFIIVGTSLQVYPAASLINYAPNRAKIYYIDQDPKVSHELAVRNEAVIIKGTANIDLPILVEKLLVEA